MIIANEPTGLSNRTPTLGLMGLSTASLPCSCVRACSPFIRDLGMTGLRETGDITIMSIKSVFVNIVSSLFFQQNWKTEGKKEIVCVIYLSQQNCIKGRNNIIMRGNE